MAADVRVIATANQNLDALAAIGQFRRDLLYRLNGYVIALPHLRERRGDVAILVEYFLRQSSRRLGKALQAVAPDVLHVLEHHRRTGNVRELENVIRFAAIQTAGDVLTVDCLPATVRGVSPASGSLDETVYFVGVRRFVQRLLPTGSLEIYRYFQAEVERVVTGEVFTRFSRN